MTGLSLLSGSFAFSAANSARAASAALSKTSSVSYSPATSTRNTKDVYTLSTSAAPRSTYSLPSKVVQAEAKPVPTPNFQIPDIEIREEEMFKVTYDGGQSWTMMTREDFLRSKQPVDKSIAEETAGTGNPIDLFMIYDETGAWTIHDADGNDLLFARAESSIWDLARLEGGKGMQELVALLEENPGLIWMFGTTGRHKLDDVPSVNRAYEGHDILNAIFPNVYGSVQSYMQGGGKVVDEYGFTFDIPAWSSGGDFKAWSAPGVYHEDSERQYVIQSQQLRGLNYLTLEEHDIFYAEVQKIFDNLGVQKDARKEDYVFVPSLPEDYVQPAVGCNGEPLPEGWTKYPGGWLWTDFNSGSFGIDQKIILQVEEAMTANSAIQALFEKAEKVRDKVIADDTLAQNYSILVVDKEGNRLANDRIIVASENGNQVEMSVEQFSQMSRLEVTKLLR